MDFKIGDIVYWEGPGILIRAEVTAIRNNQIQILANRFGKDRHFWTTGKNIHHIPKIKEK